MRRSRIATKTDLRASTTAKMRAAGDYSGSSLKKKGKPKTSKGAAGASDLNSHGTPKAPSGKGRRKTDQQKRRVALEKKDAIWSSVVRTCAGYYCERCEALGIQRLGTEAHHLLEKGTVRFREYRHDPVNGIWLCADCHRLGKDAVENDRPACRAWWAMRNDAFAALLMQAAPAEHEAIFGAASLPILSTEGG